MVSQFSSVADVRLVGQAALMVEIQRRGAIQVPVLPVVFTSTTYWLPATMVRPP